MRNRRRNGGITWHILSYRSPALYRSCPVPKQKRKRLVASKRLGTWNRMVTYNLRDGHISPDQFRLLGCAGDGTPPPCPGNTACPIPASGRNRCSDRSCPDISGYPVVLIRPHDVYSLNKKNSFQDGEERRLCETPCCTSSSTELSLSEIRCQSKGGKSKSFAPEAGPEERFFFTWSRHVASRCGPGRQARSVACRQG